MVENLRSVGRQLLGKLGLKLCGKIDEAERFLLDAKDGRTTRSTSTWRMRPIMDDPGKSFKVFHGLQLPPHSYKGNGNSS